MFTRGRGTSRTAARAHRPERHGAVPGLTPEVQPGPSESRCCSSHGMHVGSLSNVTTLQFDDGAVLGPIQHRSSVVVLAHVRGRSATTTVAQVTLPTERSQRSGCRRRNGAPRRSALTRTRSCKSDREHQSVIRSPRTSRRRHDRHRPHCARDPVDALHHHSSVRKASTFY